jgi:hypothetical protein
MMKKLLLISFFAFVLSPASDVFAAIYKYTDNAGNICFADDLQSVPQQYRAAVKIVSGEAEGEKKPLQQNQPQARQDASPAVAAPAPVREPEPAVHVKDSFFTNRVLISGIVVVSALFAFVILGILDADHKKSIKIVRVVILWGASVYLLVAHSGDVIRMFRSVDSNIEAIQRQSGEKGKKAAKSMKEINALIQHVDNATSQDSGGADPEKKD